MDLGSGEVGECWRRTLGWAWTARPGGWTEVWRFGAAAANHPSPSGDREGTLWEYGEGGECYRVKKIIIF